MFESSAITNSSRVDGRVRQGVGALSHTGSVYSQSTAAQRVTQSTLSVRDKVHELLTAAWEAGGDHDFTASPDRVAFDLLISALDVPEYKYTPLECVTVAVIEWRADR